MRTSLCTVFICFLLGFTGVPAQALPVGTSLVEMGGLQWLSPTYSLGYSYAAIQTQLGDTGSEYFGLRYATVAEVNALIETYWLGSAGLPYPYQDLLLDVDTVNGFFQDFGSSATTSNGGRMLLGITGDDFADPGVGPGVVPGSYVWSPNITEYLNAPVGISGRYAWYATVQKDFAAADYGHWLVATSTQPVPEPATLLLLSGGMAGWTFWRKRRRS